jgi:exosortase A-associated hydrolase 2
MPAAPGQRLCVYHPAAGAAPRSLIVHAHPFAEEMNKTRRMAALQARRLAEAGHAVLQIDLLGCGDSSGDFADAAWQAWVDDLIRACDWLRGHTQASAAPLWLWGQRAGCLLAAEAARQMAGPCNFLFWQPTPSGKLVLQQFLRLKAASDMLDGGAKGVVEGLRQALAAGQPVEVAGYTISPALSQGLEAADLAPPPAAGRLEWLDVSTRTEAALTPVSAKAIEQWRQAGAAVRSQIVPGPSFWQTTEIEEAPLLLDATIAALEQKQEQAAAS